MCLLNLGLLGMYDFSQDGVNKNACGLRHAAATKEKLNAY